MYNKSVSLGVKRELYEFFLADTFGVKLMKYYRVTRWDGARNEEVIRRFGMKKKINIWSRLKDFVVV